MGRLSTIAVAPFALRAAFFGAVTYVLERYRVLTIQWDLIFKPLKKLGAKLDQTGDGKFTLGDVHFIVNSRLFPAGSAQRDTARAVFGVLDKNQDGDLDVEDIKAHTADNMHAAAGGAVGFACGLAKGLGALSAGPLKKPPLVEIEQVPTLRDLLGKAAKVGKGAIAGAAAGAAGAMKDK